MVQGWFRANADDTAFMWAACREGFPPQLKPMLWFSHGPALQALEHIAAASDPTASHNCWALKVAGSARSNDDGEPGGTGG